MIPGGEPATQGRVGAVMLGLILAAGVFVVAILPRIDLGDGVRVRVLFEHVGALKEGAPLIVAGRTAGKVESITLVPAGAFPPDHPLAATGGSVVLVRVDDDLRHMVPVDGDFFISSRGVLSDRYLEVGPPPGWRERDPSAAGRPIAAGDEIRGIDPPTLDRALQRTWDNLETSRRFLEDVSPELDALRAALTRLSTTLAEVEPTPGAYAELGLELARLWGEARELRQTLESAGATPAELRALADRAVATVDHARAAVARVRTAADALAADLDRVRRQAGAAAPDAVARLRAVLDDGDRILARADRMLAGTRELMAMLARGEGSLMKLSRDPEFPEDAKELGKLLKRSPWRIIGHPDDRAGLPPRAPPRPR
jgi:ABC-type transporter Mla subunit MlaD